MRILLVHQNFPGQYRHLAAALATRHEVVALGEADHLRRQSAVAGVHRVGYSLPADPGQPPAAALRPLHSALRRGIATAEAARSLRDRGFAPDLICVHPGWGEAILLREVFPRARIVGYFEFFYHPAGADVGFDPEWGPRSPAQDAAVQARNAHLLLGMAACDEGITPTRWQHRQLPVMVQTHTAIVHDGIDTRQLQPDPQAELQLSRKGLRLTRRDHVVTYVARNLEPYRGFHVFMRALPELLRQQPDAHIVIVGSDGHGYSPAPRGAANWREKLLAEVGTALDPQRVHFLGRLPFADYLRVLQVSSAHVYLSYPFVLSWSCLEAMSVGCAMVGSRTPPVEEVMADGEHGLLVDFFDTTALVDAIGRQLHHPVQAAAMGRRARERVVTDYDLHQVCLPAQLQLLDA